MVLTNIFKKMMKNRGTKGSPMVAETVPGPAHTDINNHNGGQICTAAARHSGLAGCIASHHQGTRSHRAEGPAPEAYMRSASLG